MDERKGYRQIWISDKAFKFFQDLRDSLPPAGSDAAERQRQQQQQGGGCGLVVIFGPDGDIQDAHCGAASCGIIGWFLGRSCKASITPSGGGHSVSCSCGGGWWDRIFGG